MCLPSNYEHKRGVHVTQGWVGVTGLPLCPIHRGCEPVTAFTLKEWFFSWSCWSLCILAPEIPRSVPCVSTKLAGVRWTEPTKVLSECGLQYSHSGWLTSLCKELKQWPRCEKLSNHVPKIFTSPTLFGPVRTFPPSLVSMEKNIWTALLVSSWPLWISNVMLSGMFLVHCIKN